VQHYGGESLQEISLLCTLRIDEQMAIAPNRMNVDELIQPISFHTEGLPQAPHGDLIHRLPSKVNHRSQEFRKPGRQQAQ
jgi:hypothetical protein